MARELAFNSRGSWFNSPIDHTRARAHVRIHKQTHASLCRGFARISVKSLLICFFFRVLLVNPPVVLRPAAFLNVRLLVPCFFASLCVHSSLSCKNGISYLFYADDTQLHLPSDPGEINTAVNGLNSCLADIMSWMPANFLKPNAEK